MTTPALARTALARIMASIHHHHSADDANAREVREALDAWEALMRRERERKEPLTGPEQSGGWRTTREYDCSYTEGYDHTSGAWCRKLSGEKREWYVGATPNADGSLHIFRDADEAKEYALGMVKK